MPSCRGNQRGIQCPGRVLTLHNSSRTVDDLPLPPRDDSSPPHPGVTVAKVMVPPAVGMDTTADQVGTAARCAHGAHRLG